MAKVVFNGKAIGNGGHGIHIADNNATVDVGETAEISCNGGDGVHIAKPEIQAAAIGRPPRRKSKALAWLISCIPPVIAEMASSTLKYMAAKVGYHLT